MKHISLLSSLLLLLSACGAAPTETPAALSTEAPLPVVYVDTQHMLTPDLAYEISAGPGFVLDASTYNFGAAAGPNAVQVTTGGRAYQTGWLPGATRMPILASDLEPLNGAARLPAFSTGQQLIVAIGSSAQAGSFDPMWVGVVNVQ